MSKDAPPQLAIDPEFEAKLASYEKGLEIGFREMKNEHGNAKYQASLGDPESPDELGRIWISSIVQYAPEYVDVDPDTDKKDVGLADFHYEVGGDYGGGVIIFKKQEDGSLKREVEGDLTDKEEILKLASRVVEPN